MDLNTSRGVAKSAGKTVVGMYIVRWSLCEENHREGPHRSAENFDAEERGLRSLMILPYLHACMATRCARDRKVLRRPQVRKVKQRGWREDTSGRNVRKVN